ncbi:hypothetical protein CR513_14906, partial [Mucuna pruriens]
MLPKFDGFASEDPHKHLKEFHGNTQQFGVRGLLHLDPPMRVSDICAFVKHPTDACPTLLETKPNSTKIVVMMTRQQYRQPND